MMMAWLGKSPKIAPLLVTCVSRRNPSAGSDSPTLSAPRTTTFESWSPANVSAKTSNVSGSRKMSVL